MTTPDPAPGTETRGRSKDGSFTEDWGPLLSEERICLCTIWRICLPLLFSEHVSCSYPPSTFKTVLAQVSSPKPSWWAQAFVSGCYTTFQGESHRNLCFLQIQHQQTKIQVYLGAARWTSEFTEIMLSLGSSATEPKAPPEPRSQFSSARSQLTHPQLTFYFLHDLTNTPPTKCSFMSRGRIMSFRRLESRGGYSLRSRSDGATFSVWVLLELIL